MKHSFSSGVHPLNDKVVQHHFLLGSLDNVLLYRAFCHQAVDVHLSCEEHRKLTERITDTRPHNTFV